MRTEYVFVVKMSSVQLQNEQLNPAEETSSEFEEIIVKSEEETDGQSGLLDSTRIPRITSQQTGMKHKGL